MRPEEARRLINKAFRPFYKQPERLRPALDGFEDRRTLQAVREMVYKSDDLTTTPVYYADCLHDEQRVLEQMHYISDRWNCTGRLKFLKRVLELY